ncbi:MAG: hypothetical protein IKS07_06835, partial [Lachnospiraceae bacterium]|nr:hypothetical protein [Lachnospiraceae bacterium]
MKALKIQSDMAKRAAQILLQLLYYGCLILFLWNNTMGEATGFGYLLDHAARRIFWIVFFGISALKLILYLTSGERPKRESLLLIFFGAWILLIRTQWNGFLDETFLYCPVIAMGAVGEDEGKLLKAWFWVKLLIILECYAGSMIGIIPYLVSGNGGLGADHAFGFAHKNTLGMELFSVLILGWCAFPKKGNLLTMYVGILGAMFCHRYVKSDTGTLMLAATAAAALMLEIAEHLPAKWTWKVSVGKWLGYVLAWGYFLCTLISVLLVRGYGTEEKNANTEGFFHKLNDHLHRRLEFPWKGLQTYGIHFLGQRVEMNTGEGAYFFLDNSYYYLLLHFGVGIWLAIGIVSVWMMVRIGPVQMAEAK